MAFRAITVTATVCPVHSCKFKKPNKYSPECPGVAKLNKPGSNLQL